MEQQLAVATFSPPSAKVPAVILPGHTEAHGTTCAHSLEEGIPGFEYWNVHLQSRDPAVVRERILEFLSAHAGAAVV